MSGEEEEDKDITAISFMRGRESISIDGFELGEIAEKEEGIMI